MSAKIPAQLSTNSSIVSWKPLGLEGAGGIRVIRWRGYIRFLQTLQSTVVMYEANCFGGERRTAWVYKKPFVLRWSQSESCLNSHRHLI